MSLLADALRDISGAIDHPWALVGGLAVSARTEPRLTRDVDLAVAVSDDDQAEATVRSLNNSGYRTLAVVEQDRAGRLATVRLVPPAATAAGAVIDLLFASCGIENEIVAAADDVEVFAGLQARVARSGHLFAMKVLSRDDRTRPQDQLDLATLGKVLTEADQREAERAVDLIIQRGFARQRDLRTELAEALARFCVGA